MKKRSQEAIQRPSRTTKVLEAGIDKRASNIVGKKTAFSAESFH